MPRPCPIDSIAPRFDGSAIGPDNRHMIHRSNPRRPLLTFAACALVAAPLAAADPIVQPTPASPAMERIQTAATSIPDRAVLEWIRRSPAATTRLSLFSNGLAVLKTTPGSHRDGEAATVAEVPRTEHRLLSPEEMAVYEKFLSGIVDESGRSDGGRDCAGVDSPTNEIRVVLADRRSYGWQGCDLTSPPRAAASALSMAEDIAGSVRGKRDLDDPWAGSDPKAGEKVRRSDGALFTIVSYEPFTTMVELKQVEGPLRLRIPRIDLHKTFLHDGEQSFLEPTPPTSAAPRR